MNKLYSLLLVFLYLISSQALADSTQPQLPSLQFLPYDQAKIFVKDQLVVQSYQLALSPYEKRQNRWRPKDVIRLKGEVFKETHELASGFDEQEVFEFYQSQIPEDAKVLYRCERRKCGESNIWANNHFRIKQLYGLDQYQFYTTYQLSEVEYATLYVVRRGNRRVYAHTEIIVLTPASKG